MSSFISVKKHVEVCKRLEREIESLREQVEDLTSDCESLVHQLVAAKGMADEWKRKARIYWDDGCDY